MLFRSLETGDAEARKLIGIDAAHRIDRLPLHPACIQRMRADRLVGDRKRRWNLDTLTRFEPKRDRIVGPRQLITVVLLGIAVR